MDDRMTTHVEHLDRTPIARRDLAERLGTAGWGLFFIWAAVVLLAEIQLGIGLIGAGMITLGGQVARHNFGLRIERFWLVIGSLFLITGLWELFARNLKHVPVMLLIMGVVLLLGLFRKRRRRRAGDQ